MTSTAAVTRELPPKRQLGGHVQRGLLVRLLRGPVEPAAWRATAHLALSLHVGIAAWAFVFPFLIVGLSLLPVFLIGLPFLLLDLYLVRGLARFERARVRVFLDRPVVAPIRPPRRVGFLGGIRRDAADGATWRAIGYLLLQLPIATLGAGVVLASWSWGFAMTALPFYGWALADSDVLPLGGWWTLLWFGTGVAALLHAPHTAQRLGRMEAALAASLLGRSRTDELETQVQSLSDSRSGVVDAADAERRRIERDLHDGAQQRLVALAMNLGRARSRIATDPDGAAGLVAEAHEDAKQALVELRDLARGIHPAVLTDRGLDAAISAVAARSPVPVKVDVVLPQRLNPTVEAVAYFVVSEALANVAKHSGASTAEVRVRSHGDRLTVTVSDDGEGGASEHAGGGLAGLRGRVASVDGRLSVSSPHGGPTTISVEVPCAR